MQGSPGQRGGHGASAPSVGDTALISLRARRKESRSCFVKDHDLSRNTTPGLLSLADT